MSFWSSRALGFLFSLPMLQCAEAHADDWKPYNNPRFGTAIMVPSEFRTEPPSTNNDGRSFLSPDGRARIAVYGSHAPSVVVENFDAYRSWLAAEAGIAVSYRAHGKDWFVISGRNGQDIVYIRVIAGCANRSIAHHVQISYPADEKRRYDKIVGRVARSLRHADGAACR